MFGFEPRRRRRLAVRFWISGCIFLWPLIGPLSAWWNGTHTGKGSPLPMAVEVEIGENHLRKRGNNEKLNDLSGYRPTG